MKLLAVCLLLSLFVRVSSDNRTVLYNHLLQDYRRDISPPPPVEVEVQLALIEFTRISTSNEFLELSVWWRMYWEDIRLSWGAEWSVGSIQFSQDKVWVPDVTFYESAAVEEQNVAKVTAYPSGSAYISVQKKITVGCGMKMSAFPYDVQRCNFTIGSWSYDGLQVDVAPKRLIASDYFEESPSLPERNLIDLDFYKGNQQWSLSSISVIWRNQSPPRPFPPAYLTCSPFRLENPPMLPASPARLCMPSAYPIHLSFRLCAYASDDIRVCSGDARVRCACVCCGEPAVT